MAIPNAKSATVSSQAKGLDAEDGAQRLFIRDASNTTTLPPTVVPRPTGNYSHVVHASTTLHLSGWMGDEPGTGRIVHRTAQGQMTQIMRNISATLSSQGSDLSKITRRRIYLVHMGDLRVVDRVWGEWVGAPHPVSTCVGVTVLSKDGALVEVEIEAVV